LRKFDLVIVSSAETEFDKALHYYNSKIPGLEEKFKAETIKVLDFVVSNPNLFPVKFKRFRDILSFTRLRIKKFWSLAFFIANNTRLKN
jgi:hypothetical protein